MRRQSRKIYIEARANTKAQRMGILDYCCLSEKTERRPTCWMCLLSSYIHQLDTNTHNALSNTSSSRPWHYTSCLCCQSIQARRWHETRSEDQYHQQGGPRTFIRGRFSLVYAVIVSSHANIINTRIITRLKNFGSIDEVAKARLIIQLCQDTETSRIVSNAPTLSHTSICILISFAAIKDCTVWTKDDSLAFLQGKESFLLNQHSKLRLDQRSDFKRLRIDDTEAFLRSKSVEISRCSPV
jgi:hypothetical protein